LLNVMGSRTALKAAPVLELRAAALAGEGGGRGADKGESSMKKVLTIDDSATVRQLIRSMLEPEGYVVLEAADGLEGLEALRASAELLVVLLDYQMPNMDGGQLLQAVVDAGAPLTSHEYIVVSGFASTFPVEFIDLLRYLSIRVLPKPFESDALVALVAQAEQRLRTEAMEPLPVLPEA
jgi:CheY-like chemotaxis protein